MANAILVEDDVDLRMSLIDALGASGHAVIGVGSAVEFYQQLAAATDLEVAILDVNLPHYDGLSIAEYLSANTDLAIIMITGRGSSEDRVKGYRAGADLYLVKPVDCEELSAAIDSLSRKRSARLKRPESDERFWQLDRSGFRLIAPNGAGATLTRRELQLLDRFLAPAGTMVERSALLAIFGYVADDPASRALDAAVSRLRAKVQVECGLALPLLTVQGRGFVFSGRLDGVEARLKAAHEV